MSRQWEIRPFLDQQCLTFPTCYRWEVKTVKHQSSPIWFRDGVWFHITHLPLSLWAAPPFRFLDTCEVTGPSIGLWLTQIKMCSKIEVFPKSYCFTYIWKAAHRKCLEKGTKFLSFASKAGQSNFFSTSRASWLTVQDLCPSLLLMTKCCPGLIKLATLRHPRCSRHCLKASSSFLYSSQLTGCRSSSFSKEETDWCRHIWTCWKWFRISRCIGGNSELKSQRSKLLYKVRNVSYVIRPGQKRWLHRWSKKKPLEKQPLF